MVRGRQEPSCINVNREGTQVRRLKVVLATSIAGLGFAMAGGVVSAHHNTPDDNFAPVCTNPSNAGGHHLDKGDPGKSGGPGNGTGKDCSPAAAVTPTPPGSGVQGVTVAAPVAAVPIPGTGNEDFTALGAAGFLVLGGLGMLVGGLLVRQRRPNASMGD
jgi:hypothetical protein